MLDHITAIILLVYYDSRANNNHYLTKYSSSLTVFFVDVFKIRITQLCAPHECLTFACSLHVESLHDSCLIIS